MEENQIKLVEDFKNIAARFCAVIETFSQLSRDEFLSRIYSLLPELIKGGASLPEVSDEEDSAEGDFTPLPPGRMRQAEWQQLYEALKEKLKPNVIYWHVWDPWKSSESQEASLADDIADIYRDLRNGSKELSMRDMVFDWRLGFYSHWGQHAAGALRAIHDLMEEART